MKYYDYKFLITSDDNSFTISTVATTQESAENMICKAELCPKSALSFMYRTEIKV